MRPLLTRREAEVLQLLFMLAIAFMARVFP